MNILERFKKLSNEDKKHLSIYSIYNEIYGISESNNFEISDEDAMKIQEKSYELYLDDDYHHLSAPDIAYFLTDCHMNDELFINKLDDLDSYDLLQAVIDYDLEFYKKDDLEL